MACAAAMLPKKPGGVWSRWRTLEPGVVAGDGGAVPAGQSAAGLGVAGTARGAQVGRIVAASVDKRDDVVDVGGMVGAVRSAHLALPAVTVEDGEA